MGTNARIYRDRYLCREVGSKKRGGMPRLKTDTTES